MWTFAYTLGTGVANTGAYGLIVDYSGANPVIYATTNEATGNRVIKIIDVGAGSSAITIVAAQSGVINKGICFAPVVSGMFGKMVSQSTIQTNSNNQLFKIQVFPNPSATEFNLLIQNNSKEKVEVVVRNLYRQNLYSFSTSGNTKHVFGKNFSAGMYLVQVRQGSYFETLKIIKGN